MSTKDLWNWDSREYTIGGPRNSGSATHPSDHDFDFQACPDSIEHRKGHADGDKLRMWGVYSVTRSILGFLDLKYTLLIQTTLESSVTWNPLRLGIPLVARSAPNYPAYSQLLETLSNTWIFSMI